MISCVVCIGKNGLVNFDRQGFISSVKRRLEKAVALCYSVKMSGIRRETASGSTVVTVQINDIII